MEWTAKLSGLVQVATIALVILACIPPAKGQTLQWPVTNPQITQGYAAFNQIGNNKYHAGLDIISSTGNLTVRAAASGTVKTVQMGDIPGSPNNHGMGHTVIIEHPQLGLYTLYAHLANISVSNGQFVTAGTQIGIMGNTGGNFGVHLHFELKHFGVLGNIHDTSVSGNQWGYTLTHPNLWGYVNPWPYLDHSLNQIDPTGVTSPSNQIVRTGPNAFEYTTVVANVTAGQQFAALAEHNGWYQIYLASINGPATGWIQATPNFSLLVGVDDPTQSHIGVNVRQNSTTSSSVVSKVWDRQWFVPTGQPTNGTGCTEPWQQIHLASNASVSNGWVCGQFLMGQGGPGCTYSLSLVNVWYPATGGPGWFDVIAPNGCTWNASSSARWVTINDGASGNGAGTVGYTVAQNNSADERVATITVADEIHTINQAGAPCTYSVSPSSASFSASGGTSSFNVNTNGASCTWSAVVSDNWVTITSGASGAGNGPVAYSVAQNNSPDPRSATVTVEGQVHTITQDGIGCSYAVSATSAFFGASGGSGSFGVTAPAGCAWSAVSNAGWVTITGGSSGSGDGTVTYSVASNPNPDPRTAAITVQGQTHTINQAGENVPTEWTWTLLHPAGASFSYASGTTDTYQTIYAVFPGQGGRAGTTSGSAASYVSLHPAGAQFSSAEDAFGSQQVGYAQFDGIFQAGYWSGAPTDWISLHPAGFDQSRAYATSGGQQVGFVIETPASMWTAALWQGSAQSYVSLHPQGAWHSQAFATDGSQQVGTVWFGGPFDGGPEEAVLWTGSAASVVSLRPPGAGESHAYAVSSGQQAGWANFDGSQAGIWAGTSDSWVSLHPVGATSSQAWATSGTYQAGIANFGQGARAVIWSGSAASCFVLHDLLPLGEFVATEANAIWESNGILTVVGRVETASGQTRAILWTGPEPAATIPGDFNGDGVVNVFDLLELLAQWGPCPDCPAQPCPADLDDNCTVNVFDLLILLGNWG